MTFFQQRILEDGSMPYIHIAEVVAVSFTGPEMRIRIISVDPPEELPSYFLPEGGSAGDPLSSLETVESHYCPAVPRNFPPGYDPEVDPLPEIITEYISARYFQAAEKVLVMQDGRDYFVLSRLSSQGRRDVDGIGVEIEHESWLSMMDGAVFVPTGNRILLPDGTLYSVPEKGLPLYRNSFQNYNLVQSLSRHQSFPIFVFPQQAIVNLDIGWTWASGAYNYAYFHKKSLYSSFVSPSVTFPFKTPDIRLEIQTSEQYVDAWQDVLPDVEIYVTSSDMGIDPAGYFADFINNDNHVELILTIPRPWGTVPDNYFNNWRTSNWVPPLLFAPDESQSNPPGPTDLPKAGISFGFIDYRKAVSDGVRDEVSNKYKIVTGKIFAELKPESLGKPLLGKNDYVYSATYSVLSEDSGYTLHVKDTGVVVDSETKQYTQTSKMNQPLQTTQDFLVCTDGTNTLKKRPILEFIKSITVNDNDGPRTSVSIDLDIEHRVNSTLMFTSSFHVNEDGTVWNQRFYYLYSIDLVNKLFMAHVYIFDEPNEIQKVECVVIDHGIETVIWTYDRSDNLSITSPVNTPPWMLSSTFPEHPRESGFIGERSFFHTEYIWKAPYFANLNFPINTATGGECTVFTTIVAVPIGVFFPCTEFDEDIRSVILFCVVHYKPSVEGYTQQKEHYSLTPRRNGWVAFFRCCFSPLEGDIINTYGNDIIVKENGVVSDGQYLFTDPPDDELEVHEI